MIDKSWYTRPAGVAEHESAGGIVARAEKKNVYVALAKGKQSGNLFLPKGHIEANETAEQAAFREIGEETGLHDIRLIEKLAVKERLSFYKKIWKITHYFLFITDQIHGTPTDIENHDAFQWTGIENLSDVFWPEQRELIKVNREKILRALKIFL